jgi:hypothetical protein
MFTAKVLLYDVFVVGYAADGSHYDVARDAHCPQVYIHKPPGSRAAGLSMVPVENGG